MTAQRARAYGQVCKLLDELSSDHLSDAEVARVRSAADSLVLCGDLHADETARSAIVDLEALARQLTETNRWPETRANELVWAVLACGPREPVIHRAAA